MQNEIYLWRFSFLSLYTGANVQDLSACHWDEEEVIPGGNHLLLTGYEPTISGLAKDIDIIMNTQVKSVHYDKQGVKLITNHGDFAADAVVITVPLGVLKKQNIIFKPELPKSKQQAIANLGMGLLNKIALKFPKRFWSNEYQTIGYCADHYHTVSGFVNYSYYFKQPILVGFTGGKLARELELLDDQDFVQQVMQELQGLFGNTIPQPTNFQITRWDQDPFSYGAYSYFAVGSSGEDCDELAAPIDNRVFFAGEATNHQYSATTHGAYLSGIKAAEMIKKM